VRHVRISRCHAFLLDNAGWVVKDALLLLCGGALLVVCE